jgi:prepilin-type N-terminal cleavage/methylation domain-containing protein
MIGERFEGIRGVRGVSLLEILIGLSIFAIALLALAAAGGVAARQVAMGRSEMHRWAAIQQQVESIVATGYDSVSAGSAVVQGYPMSWTVSGVKPKRVQIITQRKNYAHQTVEDTVVVSLTR